MKQVSLSASKKVKNGKNAGTVRTPVCIKMDERVAMWIRQKSAKEDTYNGNVVEILVRAYLRDTTHADILFKAEYEYKMMQKEKTEALASKAYKLKKKTNYNDPKHPKTIIRDIERKERERKKQAAKDKALLKKAIAKSIKQNNKEITQMMKDIERAKPPKRR